MAARLSIPVIASLNAATRGGWVRFAKLIEQAGADALELNIYFIPTSTATTTAQVEDRYQQIVAAVRQSISIPLAVKIGPYFAALPAFARRLIDTGAAGLVLLNRYLEPEFDIDNFSVRPSLQLSRPEELRLPLRWIAILYGQLDASLAATSGIHDAQGVIKAILAGADVAMMASVLLAHGPETLEKILQDVRRWMANHNYNFLNQIRGLLSRAEYAEPEAFERANYMEALASYRDSF